MNINKFFSNVSWENACTYNMQGTGKLKCQGGADVEHIVETKPTNEDCQESTEQFVLVNP
jgi:hypothetical protein